MADYTTSRAGQINGAGDERALFLKKFSGDVLNVLPQLRDTLGMTNEKTIREGKSYQFPYTGLLTGQYHVPGAEIDGQITKQNERVISLDDLMVVPRFVPKIDDVMSHYDTRKEYAEKMAEFLAVTQDQHVLQEAILGARETTSVVEDTGAVGTVITNDKFQIDGVGTVGSLNNIELVNAILGALEQANKSFLQKNVRNVKKVLYVGPDIYSSMVNAVDTNGFSLFNKDYVNNGSLEEGQLPPVFGIHIRVTNNLPTTDLSGITGPQDTDGIHFYHKGDFSQTVGVIMCEKAVGVVKGSDIKMELGDYDVRYKGTLLTADYFGGAGWLRPECLVELKLNTLVNP